MLRCDLLAVFGAAWLTLALYAFGSLHRASFLLLVMVVAGVVTLARVCLPLPDLPLHANLLTRDASAITAPSPGSTPRRAWSSFS